MPSLRDVVERLLPWYHPAVEHARNARTTRIVKRSEEARERADRAVAEYRAAEKVASRAGDRLVEEVERDDR